jgi:hypothetical protein
MEAAMFENMMIELVLSVCSLAMPEALRCQERHLTFVVEDAPFSEITPFQCMKFGLPEIAKYLEGHPNQQVERWKCRKVTRRQVPV